MDIASSQQRRWSAKVDVVIVIVIALVVLLLPGLLLNVLLWFGHLAGMGIYDPVFGGDPSWQARPVLIPLVVAFSPRFGLGLRFEHGR